MGDNTLRFGDHVLSATEVADIIWLAAFLAQTTPDDSDEDVVQSEQKTVEAGTNDIDPVIDIEQEQTNHVSALAEEEEPPDQSGDHISEGTATVHSPAAEEGKAGYGVWSGVAFRAPRAPAIAETMAMMQSLRPLQRRIPSSHRFFLDEDKTAEQIAAAVMGRGSWWPIKAPVQERWLDLILLVDCSPSMALWQQTADEFRQLLANTGIFRNIVRWNLKIVEQEGAVNDAHRTELRLQHPLEGGGIDHRSQSATELLDQRRRRLFLVISDCSSVIWDSGAAQQLLEPLAAQNLVSIVQMLPEKLWETTALRLAEATRLRAQRALAANAEMIPERKPRTSGYPIPVFSLDPTSLSRWARFMVGKESGSVVGYYLPAESDSDIDVEQTLRKFGITPRPLTESPQVDVDDVYATFRARVPERAQPLAAYFAAAPLTLPVMRMVQTALLPNITHADFARVFYSGLIQRSTALAEGMTGREMLYEFTGGDAMRRFLLTKLPSYSAEQVVDLVITELSRYMQAHLEQLDSFDAVLAVRGEQGAFSIDPTAQHFAEVTSSVLRYLGGVYEHVADNLDRITLPDQIFENADERAFPQVAGGKREPEPAKTDFSSNLPPVIPYFSGREAKLGAIYDALHTKPHVLVVVGPSGVGKTQLALAYAHAHRRDYRLIWLLRARDMHTLNDDLYRLGQALGLPVENDDVESVRESVLDWLNARHNWLLLIDNVDKLSPRDLEPYLPGDSGHTLITTWRQSWPGMKTLTLGGFSAEEAVAFLQQRLSGKLVEKFEAEYGEQTLARLAQVLDYLPLALESAAVQMLAERQMPDPYLQLLREKRADLPFVNRLDELKILLSSAADTRYFSISAPAGYGKTRLVQELGQRLKARSQHEAYNDWQFVIVTIYKNDGIGAVSQQIASQLSLERKSFEDNRYRDGSVAQLYESYAQFCKTSVARERKGVYWIFDFEGVPNVAVHQSLVNEIIPTLIRICQDYQKDVTHRVLLTGRFVIPGNDGAYDWRRASNLIYTSQPSFLAPFDVTIVRVLIENHPDDAFGQNTEEIAAHVFHSTAGHPESVLRLLAAFEKSNEPVQQFFSYKRASTIWREYIKEHVGLVYESLRQVRILQTPNLRSIFEKLAVFPLIPPQAVRKAAEEQKVNHLTLRGRLQDTYMLQFDKRSLKDSIFRRLILLYLQNEEPGKLRQYFQWGLETLEEMILDEKEPSDWAVGWLEIRLRECSLLLQNQRDRQKSCQDVLSEAISDLKSLYEIRWMLNLDHSKTDDIYSLIELIDVQYSDLAFLLNYHLRDRRFERGDDSPYRRLQKIIEDWSQEIQWGPTPVFDLAQIGKLLAAAFSSGEINTLAFDLFYELYGDFSSGMTKSDRIRRIVEEAEKNSRIPDLLAYVKTENRHKYDLFAPKLTKEEPMLNPNTKLADWQQRREQLAQYIETDLDLLEKYEKLVRQNRDPRLDLQYRDEIERQEAALAKWRQELEGLEREIMAETAVDTDATDLDLLEKYEKLVRQNRDPRLDLQYRDEIERQEAALAKWRQELEGLEREIMAETAVDTDAPDPNFSILAAIGDLKTIANRRQGEMQDERQELVQELTEAQQTILQRIDTRHRETVATLVARLDENQVKLVNLLLDANEQQQISKWQGEQLLLLTQQALTDLKHIRAGQLQEEQWQSILDLLKQETSLDQKLKLTIPLIPGVLEFESETVVDVLPPLKLSWQDLVKRFLD